MWFVVNESNLNQKSHNPSHLYCVTRPRLRVRSERERKAEGPCERRREKNSSSKSELARAYVCVVFGVCPNRKSAINQAAFVLTHCDQSASVIKITSFLCCCFFSFFVLTLKSGTETKKQNSRIYVCEKDVTNFLIDFQWQ